jgi:hypothetical protein
VVSLASHGKPPGGVPGGPAAAMTPALPRQRLVAPGDAAPRTAAGSPGGGRRVDDDRWADGDWDLAGSLTETEIAALAAMDRAGDDPVDDLAARDGDQRDAAPAAAGCWLAGPGLEGGEACPPPGAGPVEALPGLLPRHLGSGGGFDAGGVADQVPPGPALAGLVAGRWAAGLGRVSDDEVAGLMIAWRRVASWAAAGELAAVAELCRRRQAQVSAGADAHLAEHVGDEVAMALTLTSWAADRLVDRAQGLARLPKTMAALVAGEIDVPKALVILGELSGLGDVHASRVEAAVIGRAAGWTTGELRRAVRRQSIAADPAAARRRKERAAKQARVERWAEDAGTAALAGRDLPPAGVLAADAHLTAWAKRLKAAGLAGTLDQLRARVYLALLNGQPPGTLLPTGADGPGSPIGAPDREHDGAPSLDGSLPASGAPGGKNCPGEPETASSPAAGKPSGPEPSRHPASRPGRAPGSAGLPLRGSVNLVLPLSTWLGWSASPGEAAGFGPLDAADSRALAAALARDPATNWCVTVTGPGGRAVAHGCAKSGPGQPPGRPEGPREGPGPSPPPRVRTWLAGVGLDWLETGACSHRRESPGYRPSPALAHLVQVRQVTCTAPGCRRPATACDFEHTIPYHQGGRSCECNGGPCCRRHHRAKQASGWQLAQPCPGVFVWTTPHGRSYQTGPEPYPA